MSAQPTAEVIFSIAWEHVCSACEVNPPREVLFVVSPQTMAVLKRASGGSPLDPLQMSADGSWTLFGLPLHVAALGQHRGSHVWLG